MTTPANTYTHGHHESVLRSHRWRTAENSAAYLLPALRPGMTLLDIGAGPGTITVDLAERVAPGQVTAVEISESVLELARAEAARRGGTAAGGIVFAVADVHSLQFDDDSFDVVHAHQVLQHVADPVLALREMRRVCRPGGLVAARDGSYSDFVWTPRPPELDEWLDVYLRTARANGGEPDAGRHLAQWARDAGFTEVAATNDDWVYESEADRRWWGQMWAERILRSDMASQALAGGFASQADLERISRAWSAWAATPGASITIPNGEILAVA
ncbi:SAM-dependent methyltransferase [Frankia sp. CcI49]|uniref:class I SAM-dependent methyltransferase n=1 Tax=unclassified Frankia TaxID=2632575 RepID=UPI0006CA256B|nr:MULTISPECIES: class I SAM-dependent methyltransferase [unclassified Frankia]KPM57099.1 methyltransferase type 11 [Frankia sp. R43]ONH60187.1 SAM-dependent methyltransferase [Frankia sp. CcI49]